MYPMATIAMRVTIRVIIFSKICTFFFLHNFSIQTHHNTRAIIGKMNADKVPIINSQNFHPLCTCNNIDSVAIIFLFYVIKNS